MFAAIPPGDIVAVWVSRPDTLDYARHRIIDLRTPRTAALRVSDPGDPRLARLLVATHARWLVLERDDSFLARSRATTLRAAVCSRPYPWCGDSLDALAASHRVAMQDAGVLVISLR
jgi:hypothetical protein